MIGRSGSTARASATESSTSRLRSTLVVRERPPLVEPSEEQQVLDQRRPSACSPSRSGASPGPAPRRRPARPRGTGRRSHATRSGRPQLVRGVSHEPAQPVLRPLLRLEGRLLAVERGLDPVEHRVERRAQPADLGAVVLHVGAPGQVAARDRVGGRGDPCRGAADRAGSGASRRGGSPTRAPPHRRAADSGRATRPTRRRSSWARP